MAARWLQAVRLLLSLAFLTAFVAGCQSTALSPGPSPTTAAVIEIGAELTLGGGQGDVGPAVENAIRLAIDQANRQHLLPGYTLVLSVRDDVGASGQPDPSIGAVNALEFLNDARVAGIIGPLASDVARAQMPLTNQKGLGQISPASTASCLTLQTPESGCRGPDDLVPVLRPTGRLTYFRLAPPASLQAALTADFVYQTLAYRRVYVLSGAQDDLAASFSTRFTADGGHLVGHRRLSGGSAFPAEARSIAQSAPDAIYFAGHDPAAGAALAVLRTQLSRSIPLLIGDTLTAAVAAHTLAGSGPVYIVLAPAPQNATAQAADFVRAYQASYGPPGMYSASSYDCAWILIHAIAAALGGGARPPASADDSDAATGFRQAVLTATSKTDAQGVTGHQSFDADGDTTSNIIAIYQLTLSGASPAWKYIGAQAADA
jgi:branched-chain amino acid transport system substrate-binding protein